MTRSRRRRRRPMPLDPVNKRVQRMHVSSRRNVECSRSSCCPVLACHRTGAPSVYAVLGEATHFYTSYNTEGSTTRTLTSPSTPASNAQMAFAFVATRPVRRRRRPDRPAAAPPGPAARVVAPCGPLSRASCCETQCARHRPTRRGGHAATDHARQRRRRQAGRSKRARALGLEGTGKEMPTSTCLRPCAAAFVRPSPSARRSTRFNFVPYAHVREQPTECAQA